MNVRILRESKEELEFEVEGETYTLANLLNNYLLKQDGVNSAFKVEHPLIPRFKMLIRTHGKSPVGALKKALEEITNDIEDLEGLINQLNR